MTTAMLPCLLRFHLIEENSALTLPVVDYFKRLTLREQRCPEFSFHDTGKFRQMQRRRLLSFRRLKR